MRGRIRTGLLLGIAALYVLSVPWYRETGAPVSLLLGLPDWVAVALGCYVAVAVLNSLAWLLTDIPDEHPEPGGAAEGPARRSPRDEAPGP
jgi:hypothetical protein